MIGTPARETRVVLIVEDEPLVATMASDFLEEAGFEVVEASSADEGARILRARPDIRLLFTDIELPGGSDGVALAFAALRERPGLRVLFTSGNTVPGRGTLPEGARFVGKPYTARVVTDELNGLVDG